MIDHGCSGRLDSENNKNNNNDNKNENKIIDEAMLEIKTNDKVTIIVFKAPINFKSLIIINQSWFPENQTWYQQLKIH